MRRLQLPYGTTINWKEILEDPNENINDVVKGFQSCINKSRSRMFAIRIKKSNIATNLSKILIAMVPVNSGLGLTRKLIKLERERILIFLN